MNIPGYIYDPVRNRYFKKENSMIHPRNNNTIHYLDRVPPLHRLCMIRELQGGEALKDIRSGILTGVYGKQYLYETRLHNSTICFINEFHCGDCVVIEHPCTVTFNEKIENISRYCNIDNQQSEYNNREEIIRTNFPGKFSLFAISRNDKSFALISESFDHRSQTLFIGKDPDESSMMTQFGLFRGAIHSIDISSIANIVAFPVDQDYHTHYICTVPISQSDSRSQYSKLSCKGLISDILSLSIKDIEERFYSIISGCRNGSLLVWEDSRTGDTRPSIFQLFQKTSISSIIKPKQYLDNHYVILSTTSDELYLLDDRKYSKIVWQYDNAPCSSYKHPIHPVVCFDHSWNGSEIMYSSATEHSQIAAFKYLESPHPFMTWSLQDHDQFKLKQIMPIDFPTHNHIYKERLFAFFG